MASIFSQEYALKCYGEEMRAEGRAEGCAEGALKQAKSTALEMKKDGFPEETIARLNKVSLQTVREWLSEPFAEPVQE